MKPLFLKRQKIGCKRLKYTHLIQDLYNKN